MFIFLIPTFFIVFIILAILGIGREALQVNIMPYLSFVCVIFAIIGIIKSFTCEESEKRGHIIAAITFGIFFIITLGSSLTTGNILSWIWYHI